MVRSNFLSQWKQYSPDSTLDDILQNVIYLFLSPGHTWKRPKVSFSLISSVPTNKWTKYDHFYVDHIQSMNCNLIRFWAYPWHIKDTWYLWGKNSKNIQLLHVLSFFHLRTVGLWKNGLLAKLQVKMSTSCQILLLLPYKYQVSLRRPAYVETASPTDHLNQWKMMLILTVAYQKHIKPSHHLKNIISFGCIYGFGRLQSRIMFFFIEFGDW